MFITDIALPTKRDFDVPIHSLHKGMPPLFDDFFRGFDFIPLSLLDDKVGKFSPPVSIDNRKKEIEVTVELPGMDEKDIDVTLKKDVLFVQGEKKEEKEEKNGNYYRSERSYGSFQRTIPLPDKVVDDKVRATFKKGILTITLPKTREPEENVKKISIRSE